MLLDPAASRRVEKQQLYEDRYRGAARKPDLMQTGGSKPWRSVSAPHGELRSSSTISSATAAPAYLKKLSCGGEERRMNHQHKACSSMSSTIAASAYSPAAFMKGTSLKAWRLSRAAMFRRNFRDVLKIAGLSSVQVQWSTPGSWRSSAVHIGRPKVVGMSFCTVLLPTVVLGSLQIA